MTVVDTDAVCAAIKDVFQDTRSIVEPALRRRWRWPAKQNVARPQDAARVRRHPCGANMNFDRLRFVAERAEAAREREAVLAVTIPEERRAASGASAS